MNLSMEVGVPAITVFLQGLLSFFSPCILPLIPLYVGYLAGGTKEVGEDGQIRYGKRKVLWNTLFFIIGISFAFFLLGLGFTAVGQFFSGYRIWFVRIGGAIMVLFGVYQLGVLGRSRTLDQERRLHIKLEKWSMSPVTALILGFTFSFAWTPCVGPALASVLLMASSASTAGKGLLLIGIYMLGFVLPFLAVGLFTGTVLEFFKKYKNIVKYTVKIGGVLMILMGIMTMTGWMNGLTGYLTSLSGNNNAAGTETGSSKGNESQETPSATTKDESKEKEVIPAPDFTLEDQFGNKHKLSDYKGKTVFLNFWATWCGPCKQEMPDIQALYEEYDKNQGDLVVLGIANPSTEDYPKNSDGSIESIKDFLDQGGYNYPTVMDTTGEIFRQYQISAFPTTFMIDKEGNIFGYVTGTLTADMIQSIVEQTMNEK